MFGQCDAVQQAPLGTVCDDGDPTTMGDLCIERVGAVEEESTGALECKGLVTLGAVMRYMVEKAQIPPRPLPGSDVANRDRCRNNHVCEAPCVQLEPTYEEGPDFGSPAACANQGHEWVPADERLVMEEQVILSLHTVLNASALNVTLDGIALIDIANNTEPGAVVVQYTVTLPSELVTDEVRLAAKEAVARPDLVGLPVQIVASAFLPTPQCTCSCCMGLFCQVQLIPVPTPSASCDSCWEACSTCTPRESPTATSSPRTSSSTSETISSWETSGSPPES